MSNIILTKGIVSRIPLKAIVVWNLDNNSFFRPQNNKNCPFLSGVYKTEDLALQDVENINYQIVEIDMSNNLPEDIKRILDDKDFMSMGWTEHMLISKLRQLFEIFIFQNKELKEQLETKYLKC